MESNDSIRSYILMGIGAVIITISVALYKISTPAVIAEEEAVETIVYKVAPVKGALAPDFELQSLSGETVRLSDHQGQVVLVNFWATWCGPCKIEMPAIQDRYERYSPDLVVLAVNVAELPETVADFIEELQLTFDPLLDPNYEIETLYRIVGYPSSFFVDKDGVIQAVHIGFMTEGQLDGYLIDAGLDVVFANQ